MKVYELISELSKCPAGADVELSNEWMDRTQEDGSLRMSGKVNAVLIPPNSSFVLLDGD